MVGVRRAIRLHTGDMNAPDYWLDKEKAFVASTHESEVGNEESINIQVANPEGSGRKLYFYFAEMVHSDDVELTVHTDIEQVTGETPLTVSNNAIGSSVASEAVINQVDDFGSLDTHQIQIFIGGGERELFDGYRVLVLPGESMLIEAESMTGGNELGIRMAWAEVEGDIGTRLT